MALSTSAARRDKERRFTSLCLCTRPRRPRRQVPLDPDGGSLVSLCRFHRSRCGRGRCAARISDRPRVSVCCADRGVQTLYIGRRGVTDGSARWDGRWAPWPLEGRDPGGSRSSGSRHWPPPTRSLPPSSLIRHLVRRVPNVTPLAVGRCSAGALLSPPGAGVICRPCLPPVRAPCGPGHASNAPESPCCAPRAAD